MLFFFALQQNILAARVVGTLVAVVALRMALTPLVIMFNEKLLLPRVGTKPRDQRAADAVAEHNPVIIAGFDRFAQTVGQLLKANGIGTTVLDFDSDRVDLLRKLGLTVYSGDASRRELLQADDAERDLDRDAAWDSETLRLEVRAGVFIGPQTAR